MVVVVRIPPGVAVGGVEVVFPVAPVPGVAVEPAIPGADPGVVLVGAVAVVGTVAVVAGFGAAAAGAVTVVVVAGARAEPPARSTSAAAITPRASATTAANAPIGRFQLGACASRVRAAAPQRKHQDCSVCSGAPHTGHASPVAAGEGALTGTSAGSVLPCGCCWEVAVLTSPARADG